MDEGVPDFGAALKRAVSLVDIGAFAVPPVVLLAVTYLPLETRRAYTFAYTDPSAITAYTAHFVHLSNTHLLANVAGYLLLVTVGYPLATLASRRSFFRAAMAVYLIVFPPVLSALNLAVPRQAVAYGFSGINMALAGLLALLLVSFAGRRLHPGVSVRDAPPLFLLGLAVVAIRSGPEDGITGWVAAISVGVALLYKRPSPDWIRSVRRWFRHPSSPARQNGWLELFVTGLGLYVGVLLVGFPADLGGDGTVLNSYVHLLGFALGFLVPYIALEAGLFESDGAVSGTTAR